jgi:RNA polymerase sigma-70 factor (ECF subfamily)
VSGWALALRYHRGRQRIGEPDPAIVGLLAAARAAWPDFVVDDEAFVDHLAGVPHGDEVGAPLVGLRADDLMLACACKLGDAAALRAFEARFGELLRASFANPSASGVDGADLKQILLQRLFVGADGRRPKICEYAGRGSLHSWIKVVALRLRIDSERRVSDKVEALPDDGQDDARLEGIVEDPELQAFKLEYREAFRAVFREVLASLSAHERNLLRQSVVHGLSATEIARLHDVHRTTAKRWLAEIRETILVRTRDRFVRTVGIHRDEFHSVMRLLQSRLDVSLCRQLGDDP